MSYFRSFVEFVFSTKDSEPLMTLQFRNRLWPYQGGGVLENGMKALSLWE